MMDRLRFYVYCVRFVPCMASHLGKVLRIWAAEQHRALWGGYCKRRTGA